MVDAINLVLGAVIIFLVIIIWVVYNVGVNRGRYEKEAEWQENLVKIRREIADRQRVGIKGKVSETFAPFLKGFPFKSSECKFLGDPIDYVVFEGLDERDVKKIHFVEVKTDTSSLSKVQRQIRDLIKNNKVGFEKFDFKIEDI